MRKLTNNHDIPLVLATWLLYDEYDHVDDPHYISATSLLKPLKSIILNNKILSNKDFEITYDISDLIASRFGTGIHDSVEKAWKQNYEKALAQLGISKEAIKNVKINPKKEELTKDTIPIYIEQRFIKEVSIPGSDLKFKVGGKFDFVVDGTLNDNKTTSVYTYMKDSNRDNYIKQGSIYKWLAPELITDDVIKINYIFTDWSKKQSQYTEGYPATRIVGKTYPLWSLEETEKFIIDKGTQLFKLLDKPEEDIPRCTDEELWRTPASYKYYSGTNTSGRCSKRFDSMEEALSYKVSKGTGTIVTEPGKVNRCLYCPGAPICKQRLEYFDE